MPIITVAIGAQTRSWTVSAGDTTRIVNALKTHYGQVLDGATPPAMRDRTSGPQNLVTRQYGCCGLPYGQSEKITMTNGKLLFCQ